MFARQSGAKTAHRLDSSDSLGNVHFFDAAPRELPACLSLPEKDVPIFLVAMEARATHLITGDDSALCTLLHQEYRRYPRRVAGGLSEDAAAMTPSKMPEAWALWDKVCVV